jgi:hypothetical protein
MEAKKYNGLFMCISQIIVVSTNRQGRLLLLWQCIHSKEK